MPTQEIARFLASIERTGECWLWRGSVNTRGRARFIVLLNSHRHELHASRVAWLLAHDSDPGDKNVCHSCDNPLCVRPSHLFLGTQIDNLADMTAKGRRAIGERHAHARLTADQVREIRALLADGVLIKDVAMRFGISASGVSSIARRKTWRHLTDGVAA